MSQLSRPYQIALAVVIVFAVAWFAVLRQHTAASTATTPTLTVSTPRQSRESSAAAQEKAAAKPTHVYKGAAPGVEGLTRDVRKAHEAVGVSQKNAREVQSATGEAGRSGQTGGTAKHAGSDPSKAAGGTSTSSGSAAKPASSANSSGSVTKSAGSLPSSSPAVPAKPAGSPATRLATQLKEGRTVLLLFWNPHSTIDTSVRKQVQDVARSLGHEVAASYAKASEVGRFGTVTREITVNETPTLLVIGKKGLVTTITGLTDAFSIEQAVREAR